MTLAPVLLLVSVLLVLFDSEFRVLARNLNLKLTAAGDRDATTGTPSQAGITASLSASGSSKARTPASRMMTRTRRIQVTSDRTLTRPGRGLRVGARRAPTGRSSSRRFRYAMWPTVSKDEGSSRHGGGDDLAEDLLRRQVLEARLELVLAEC